MFGTLSAYQPSVPVLRVICYLDSYTLSFCYRGFGPSCGRLCDDLHDSGVAVDCGSARFQYFQWVAQWRTANVRGGKTRDLLRIFS